MLVIKNENLLQRDSVIFALLTGGESNLMTIWFFKPFKIMLKFFIKSVINLKKTLKNAISEQDQGLGSLGSSKT